MEFQPSISPIQTESESVFSGEKNHICMCTFFKTGPVSELNCFYGEMYYLAYQKNNMETHIWSEKQAGLSKNEQKMI